MRAVWHVVWNAAMAAALGWGCAGISAERDSLACADCAVVSLPAPDAAVAASRGFPDPFGSWATTVSPAPTAAAKRTSAFAEARIVVLNTYAAQKHLAEAGRAAYYCDMLTSNCEAFAGAGLQRWDALVAALARYISMEIVHTGTLVEKGGFVEGDIVVRPGANLALICFVNAEGLILWTSAAEYIHRPEVIRALYPADTVRPAEGWQLATVSGYAEGVWTDRAYWQEQVVAPSGEYQPFMAYRLPLVGLVGVSREYADYECGRYRRIQDSLANLAAPPGPGMRRIAAAGQTFNFAGSIPVSFSRDFMIDTTEVTQAQYRTVMGVNPSSFSGDAALPVENVSWFDAVRYCIARSTREGRAVCYDTLAGWVCDITRTGYRLPTEAEWEYAYRGGTITRYYWGDTINGAYCWYGDNSGGQTHAVGRKLPNGWGLYDMAGNVWEWCGDFQGATPASGAVDWAGPVAGTNRIMRGGQYGNYDIPGGQQGTLCLSATFRYGEPPQNAWPHLGLRCVRTVP